MRASAAHDGMLGLEVSRGTVVPEWIDVNGHMNDHEGTVRRHNNRQHERVDRRSDQWMVLGGVAEHWRRFTEQACEYVS